MALVRVRSTSAEEGTRNLRPKTTCYPQSQHKMRSSAIDSGGVGISWYRGHQTGVYEAYLTIKQKYPRVAKQLIEAFGMKENGDY